MKRMKKALALMLGATMLLGSMAFAAEEEKAAGLTGTAEATAQGVEETVTVKLSLEDGVITAVEASTDKEEETVGRMALEELPQAMVEQNTVNVDAVTGATGTSNAVIGAAIDAYLEIAKESYDLDAWAKGHGYVKAEDFNMEVGVDAVTSATASGVGGLNFGDLDLTDELKEELLLDYLKGAEGNYREMYQIATSYNNVPTIGSVEYVLDTEDFTLLGSSELNTAKLNNMLVNPNVDLYWTRQIRSGDICSEEMPVTPTYFMSYGVEITGTFHQIVWEELEGEELTKYLNKARLYYETLGYTQIVEMEDAALAGYLANLSATSSMFYEIVPTRIVMTSPWFLTPYDTGYARQYVSADVQDDLIAFVHETYPEATNMTALDFETFQATGLKTQQTITFER